MIDYITIHIACGMYCTICSESSGFMTCSACQSRYGLNSDTKTCTACPTNCASCTVSNSSNVCTACDSGYGLSADRLSCTSKLIIVFILIHFIILI